jgi:hypothetical protein
MKFFHKCMFITSIYLYFKLVKMGALFSGESHERSGSTT